MIYLDGFHLNLRRRLQQEIAWRAGATYALLDRFKADDQAYPEGIGHASEKRERR
jgi:hypothetical protein